MRPGLSTPFGSKPSFTRLRDAGKHAVLPLEHVDRGTHRSRRANQRGVAAGRGYRAADCGCAAVVVRRHREPDQAAGPIVEPPRFSRQGCGQLMAARRRGRDPPQRLIAVSATGGKRLHVAHALPERARVTLVVDVLDRPERGEQRGERSLAVRDRGSDAFQAEQGRGLDDVKPVEMLHQIGRQMRRTRHVAGRAHRRTHRRSGAGVVETEHHDGRLGFRPRQRLDRDFGHRGERAERAREQLAKVVAGDVLDHASAGLESLAAARHRGYAEKMVARRAGLDPARPGQVRRERAAERPRFGGRAEDRAVVHRLERKLLALVVHQRLDLCDRRAGFRRQHQFLRLVQRHARQRGEIEREIGLARAAERALGAATHELQRLAFRQRPAHGVLDILSVPGVQRVSHSRGLASTRTSYATNG